MTLEALDDGGAFPLSPNDVHLVKSLKERIVRKSQPSASSEDGFDQLVVVASLINPKFERQRGLARWLGHLRWLDGDSSFFCVDQRRDLRYCSMSIAFWAGTQKVQRLLTEG